MTKQQKITPPTIPSGLHDFSKITANYNRVALVLQGGGALGSYQAGVYEALHEHGIKINWVAGVSIGSINAALIAGNPESGRIDALKAFWNTVAPPTLWNPIDELWRRLLPDGEVRALVNQMSAMRTMMAGQPGFFQPRVPPVLGADSVYDTSPLKATLERLIDFDRINAGEMRLALGAVNVETGNYVYFDNRNQKIRAEHVMASGALPPGFPAVEIDGAYYWDGGLVSNTPLQQVLDDRPQNDTLVFQVDLWSARGPLPDGLQSVLERQKDIAYSSRTRLNTDQATDVHGLGHKIARLLDRLPEDLRDTPEARALRDEVCPGLINIIHLIYRRNDYDRANKDYEFSNGTMRDHWKSGIDDTSETLLHREWLAPPANHYRGIVTHDRLRE